MTDILSRRDVQFLLNEWLDVSRLADRERFRGQTVEDWGDVLTLAEQVASDQFQPHNRKADVNEPVIGEDGKVVLIPEVAEALDVLAETGLMAAAMPAEVGGCPCRPLSPVRSSPGFTAPMWEPPHIRC